MHRLLLQKWTSKLEEWPVHAQQRERAPTLSAGLSTAIITTAIIAAAAPITAAAAAAEWATSKLSCHYTCAQNQSEGCHCSLHVFRSLHAQESRVYNKLPELA